MYSNFSLQWGIPYLIGAGLIGVLYVGLIISMKLHGIRDHLRKEVVFLELTPPPSPHNTLEATEEFFTVLSHVISLRSWRDLVNGRKATLALEVVSSRATGIRYLIRLPRHDQQVFLHNLAALAPSVTAAEVIDYLSQAEGMYVDHLIDLKQTGPVTYALKHSHAASANDPIAYLTHAMSQLEDEELMVLQIVLAPTSEWQVTTQAAHHIGTMVPTDIVAATIHKQHQPQLASSVRILIRTTTDRYDERLKGIRGALTTYSYDGYQSLQPRFALPGYNRRYHLFAFRNRLPTMFQRNACSFASSELAALYHFPYGTTLHVEDIRVTRHTALPVPLDIKNQPDVDVLLGENHYRGRTTPIGLTEADRQRHLYIVGGTGNGKSTLLQYAIVQDMRAGKGVALIDPHGDLAQTLLDYVPEDRIDDVVYFNPSDIRHPIGLNLLELPPDLDEDELLMEKDMVTESVVSMFRKIFSTNDTSGHRIEYVLRNAVQTALTLNEPTLFTVYELLNDADFRKGVFNKLDNPDLKLFWREFARGGSYQQVSMAAGITAKIGRFLFSAPARRILEQPHSSINISELMDQGKILICNVSKGQLGEDTSELFGIMLLAKLQLAALRRAHLPEPDRRPFYVYVDEFQNFATPSFVQLLSEARKYGLFMTMAEQSTSQQSDRRMIDIVFANVGTIVSFRTSSAQDEKLIQPLLSPYIEPGTLSRLPAYNFYVRIAAIQAQPPFSGQTIVMDTPADTMLAQIVIQASRMQYGKRTREPLEAINLHETVAKTPPSHVALEGSS